MHLVMTRMTLKPNSHKACAELFKDANPALMERERDWLDAQLVYHPESNAITVLAKWRDAKSYEKVKDSLRFQHTMRKFGEYWAAPPEITIHEILADVNSESLGEACS